MRLAYLVSRYPAISHTFIADEVAELRRLGFAIDTFSIRRTSDEEILSEQDRAARDSTFAVLPARWTTLLVAHLLALVCSPAAYLRTLRQALRSGGTDARKIIWQFFYFAEAMIVWRECRRRGIRRLHVHFPNVAADVALLVSAYGGREWSFSLTLHGPTELSEVRSARLAEKATAASTCVCVSHYLRSQLMSILSPEQWEKLHVVRCGVDSEGFAPRPRPPRAGRPLTVLATGRLEPRKGHRLLVEMLARLRREGLDVRVRILGDGPERAGLHALAVSLGVSDHLELVGAVAHGAVAEHLRDADLFCMPSFAEGVPVALMEAMACELPVLASHLMGIPELVEDGITGALFVPGSVDDLTGQAARLLRDPETRARLGSEGRRRVKSEFEIRETGRRLAAVLSAAHAG